MPDILDPDDDNDGIYDEVDVDRLVVSGAFSDLDLGGTTFGEILDLGDQILTIQDGLETVGITMMSELESGPNTATLSVCGGTSILSISAGDQLSMTCGSVVLKIVSGIVEVVFTASDGTVGIASLIEGDELIFEPESFSITVLQTSENPVIIVIDGYQYSFSTGETTRILKMVIKPGEESEIPHPINPSSRGVTPAAVFGSDSFNTSDINVGSLKLGPGASVPAHDGHIEDVNQDGYLDLLVHFPTLDLGIGSEIAGDSVFALFLSGELWDGTNIASVAYAVIKPSATEPSEPKESKGKPSG